MLYCLPAWGGSITSKSDPIIKVQNRIIRVLTFKTRTFEARDIVRSDILDIQNLYKIEVTKIAYDFFNFKLPTPTNNIFKISSSETNKYNTRSSTRLNLFKPICETIRDENRFYNKCTIIWNNVPYPLKLSLTKAKFVENFTTVVKENNFSN